MSARWLLWKTWNRTRYYWPQAKTRKRAEAKIREFYAEHGETWKPRSPWWWPL